MTAYRCYFLDQQAHIIGVETIECLDDDDARTTCVKLLHDCGHAAAEVWESKRQVCHVEDEALEPIAARAGNAAGRLA